MVRVSAGVMVRGRARDPYITKRLVTIKLGYEVSESRKFTLLDIGHPSSLKIFSPWQHHTNDRRAPCCCYYRRHKAVGLSACSGSLSPFFNRLSHCLCHGEILIKLIAVTHHQVHVIHDTNDIEKEKVTVKSIYCTSLKLVVVHRISLFFNHFNVINPIPSWPASHFGNQLFWHLL